MTTLERRRPPTTTNKSRRRPKPWQSTATCRTTRISNNHVIVCSTAFVKQLELECRTNDCIVIRQPSCSTKLIAMRSIFEKLVLSNKWAVLQVVFPLMFDNIIARHFLRFVDQMYRRTSVLPHISVMSNKCEIPAGVIMVLFSYESFLSLTWNSHQNCKKNYFAAGRMRKFLPHPHSGNTTFFYFRLGLKEKISTARRLQEPQYGTSIERMGESLAKRDSWYA